MNPENLEENDKVFKCFPEITDSQILLNGKQTKLIPRGPLGDLLKHKQHAKQNSVETVIVHNERNGVAQDESEYKVEHLETDSLETKWVEERSINEDDRQSD